MAFTRAATLEEIEEGQGKKVTVQGKSIALLKKEGKIFATDDECPHMGGPISEGSIENNCIVCPWHGFSFDLASGKSSQNCDLKTYPVKIEQNTIFVDVE